jgi:chromosomal replication initiator protein
MAGEQLEFGDDARSIALKRAWERALRVLAGNINKASFESWIRPIRPLAYEDGQVTLAVTSAFAREWLKKYAAQIRASLEESLGSPLEIHFTLQSADDRPLFGEKEPEGREGEGARERGGEQRPTPNAQRPTSESDSLPSLPLNEKYTFDTFVVGKSNRLAQAGAAAVSASPGAVYNPLFLYGGSGLGKTHLLHAIGHAARARGEARIAFVDGERFTEAYVTSLRERKTEEFRRLYRSVDIWLVDDIQHIASREQTKEEFFHTFNALYQTGRQIVISSDRSPRELREMDERLRSRFECGLIADINPPELETRVAILERRCRAEGWSIPADVLFFIASAIQSNIRALEGALIKLVAYSSVMDSPYSIELAQSVLGEYFIEKPAPRREAKSVPVETILRAAAEGFGTTVDALLGQRRDKNVATARQAAMFLCRELTETPLTDIGMMLGGRDPSTVRHAIAKMEALLNYDPSVRRLVQEIRSNLEH